jgi:hypothetical protein
LAKRGSFEKVTATTREKKGLNKSGKEADAVSLGKKEGKRRKRSRTPPPRGRAQLV